MPTKLEPWGHLSEFEEIKALNRELIGLTDISDDDVVVDLGCGMGAVTRLILELGKGRASQLTAVEPDSMLLEAASLDLAPLGVRCVHADAESFASQLEDPVDVVVMANAFHLVPDKPSALAQIRSLLKPGGRFGFSSTFFRGAELPETRQVYWKIMYKAYQRVRQEFPEFHRPAGAKPIAAPSQRLHPDDYQQLLERSGLEVTVKKVESIAFSQPFYRMLASSESFAEGALPGVPPEFGASVLEKSVAEVIQKTTAMPRGYMFMVGVKVA